jgi:aspartyl protease family protein
MALSPGMRQAAKLAAGWTAAAGGVALGIAYFGEIGARVGSAVGVSQDAAARPAGHRGGERKAPSGRVVELRAGAHGHYRTRAEINGRPVDVMIDTGASMVALSYDDARTGTAGIHVRDSEFTHRVSTANGFARVAPVTIDRISIGDITVRNVPGAVMEAGKLDTSLLGMSFLARLQRVDMRSGTLVLQE